jgi:hypothetical protein
MASKRTAQANKTLRLSEKGMLAVPGDPALRLPAARKTQPPAKWFKWKQGQMETSPPFALLTKGSQKVF